MSNGDPLALYSVSQLPDLFRVDANCKFLALKIKQERQNTALHAIYIEQSQQGSELTFCALVTVAEWDGKTEKEEFFFEAENIDLLLEKLQRFDEIEEFVFIQVANSLTIDTLSLPPQTIFSMVFPELAVFGQGGTQEELVNFKKSSYALLNRLEQRHK